MPNSVTIEPYSNSVDLKGPNSVTVETIQVSTTWFFLSPDQIIPLYEEVAA